MLIYYHRVDHVICLETDVLEDKCTLSSMLSVLPDSGLLWYWSSSRRYPPARDFQTWELPEQRAYTTLTVEALPVLYRDLLEQDLNDDNRNLVLVASQSDLALVLQDVAARQRVLAAFAQEQPPLQLVLVRLGDTGSCHIFIPHKPSAAVSAVLAAWGIDPVRADTRRSYQRLNLVRFEALFGLETEA
ncbi:MAG: hypothetical protein WAZ19_01860 [Anaerolineae bacterium]